MYTQRYIEYEGKAGFSIEGMINKIGFNALTGATKELPKVKIRTFATMTKSLFELLQCLESKEIESTGIYRRPVYNTLEGYLDITLVNAQWNKNVPGYKTDVSDAEWIAKLLRHGLVEPSFVSPAYFREIRDGYK